MFPFGNYQKSSQERQNSIGSPAIRRPDLYNPAEVDIRFLTFENPAKAVKQPPLYIHQCMFLYWTVDLMTSWPHPVHPELLPFLSRMPFSPNIASHAKILTNLALRSRGQIPYPVDEFCIFFNPVLNFGSTPAFWECHSRLSLGRQKCNVQQPHDTEGLNRYPSNGLKI